MDSYFIVIVDLLSNDDFVAVATPVVQQIDDGGQTRARAGTLGLLIQIFETPGRRHEFLQTDRCGLINPVPKIGFVRYGIEQASSFEPVELFGWHGSFPLREEASGAEARHLGMDLASGPSA